jgi:hypothetical protein
MPRDFERKFQQLLHSIRFAVILANAERARSGNLQRFSIESMRRALTKTNLRGCPILLEVPDKKLTVL